MAEIVATNVVASRPPNGDRLQRRPLVPKRSPLKLKDQLEMMNRDQENRKKLMMQDTLWSSNRQKIQKLRSRKHFLAWQTDYTKCKESLKQVGLANWRSELLKIVKSSLKI